MRHIKGVIWAHCTVTIYIHRDFISRVQSTELLQSDLNKRMHLD